MLHTVINWTGFPGAPGFTNLYWPGPFNQVNIDSSVQATSNFCDALHFFTPSDVTMQASLTVEEIDPANGDLLNVGTSVVSAPGWVGAIAGGYPAPCGAVINWRTASLHRARRVRGRTFIVPLGGTQYDSAGSLIAGAVTGIQAAGTALVTAGLGVWARPKGPPPVVAGAFYDVVAASVPDKSCVLRSRRD